MGIQVARASTVARPFMRLMPQLLTVQVPSDDAEAEVWSCKTGAQDERGNPDQRRSSYQVTWTS